jgi:colanic acid biosynthesis glycosyl transferase WcaI
MRILVYGINYAPELTGIGKYTSEMCEWFAENGHEVTVITAPPYYPQWKVADGFSKYNYTKEDYGNVHVVRCPLWVPRKPSGGKRILHLASFALTSLPRVMSRALKWKPDLIITIEPPLFCSPATLLAGKLARAKTWLHIQDFEIDAAFNLGLIKSNVLQKFANRIEIVILGRFDRVSTISDKMFDKLRAKGVKPFKQVLFPNWVDTNLIRPLGNRERIRRKLGIKQSDTVCLYSGNMGEKQGLEVIVQAARQVEKNSRIHFILCGDGAARSRLEHQAAGLPNIHFLPLQPLRRFNYLLNVADIHLLPQKSNAADLVMPSKLTAMLASGQPVVATVDYDSQVAQVVEHCGLAVKPEDAGALAKAISWLHEHGDARERLGNKGREFAVREWNREKILYRVFMPLFEQMSKARPSGPTAGATVSAFKKPATTANSSEE